MALLIAPEPNQREKELLEAEIKSVGTHALVALAGEVDVSTVGQLYEQLAALQRDDVRHLVLNMSEVTFVDSAGLSVLVTLHKRMESVNGELIIFSPSAQLRRLFQLTGLDSYVNIRPRMDRSRPRD